MFNPRFVRPVEMTRIRICDVDLQKGTLTLNEDQTKIRLTQTATVRMKLSSGWPAVVNGSAALSDCSDHMNCRR